jgi:hypothetical protein
VTPAQRELRDRLAAVPERLAGAASAVSPEPPAPGEWPPTDVVRHLIAVEDEVWHNRLHQLGVADRPTWQWVEPDPWQGQPGATLEELLAAFATRRAETVAILDGFDEAGWARHGIHATWGGTDVAALVRRALDHDDEHIAGFEAT